MKRPCPCLVLSGLTFQAHRVIGFPQGSIGLGQKL
jgi:hypothetical protein